MTILAQSLQDPKQKWDAIQKWRWLMLISGLAVALIARHYGILSVPAFLSSCIAGSTGILAFWLAIREKLETAAAVSIAALLILLVGTEFFVGKAPFWVWAITGWPGVIATLGIGGFFSLKR